MESSQKNPGLQAGALPGPAPVSPLWLAYSVLLVLIMDQAGANGTVPASQQFPLLDLGLAGAVVVLWLRGWKWWPAVALAGLISGALLRAGWLGTPLYAAGLVAGAGAARVLLTLCGFDARLRKMTDVMALAFLAGPAAALISSVFAATGAMFSGSDRSPLEYFLAEWLGGWTGILMAAPFLLSLSSEYFRRWNPARSWEWVLVNMMLVASLLLMMHFLTGGDQTWYPLAYLALPFVFWTAWRFGPSGAALANLFIGAVTAFCAHAGLGPFAGQGGYIQLLLAWSFLGFHGLVALLLAAVTDERRLELQQQRQRARFLRQVLEQLPCGVLLKDINDQPLLVNKRWFELFGRAGGTEEDQAKHQRSVEPFWRGRELMLLQNIGELFREEAEAKDKLGQRVELLLTKQAAYFDERGERLLMVVADDVSTGRIGLQETRAALATMRQTLQVAEIGMWDWNIPAGTIRVDKLFRRLVDLPESQEVLSVAEWQNFIHPDDRANFQHDLLRHLHHQAELFLSRFRFNHNKEWVTMVVRGRVVETDVRKLGTRMLGTLQQRPASAPTAPVV